MVREKDYKEAGGTQSGPQGQEMAEKEMIFRDQKDDQRRMITQQIALVFACVSLCSGM